MFNNHEYRVSGIQHLVSSNEHLESSIAHRLASLLATRVAPLHLSRELYKSNIFLQNKANSPGVQDDTTSLITRTYKNLWPEISLKNKAKQSQFKAIFYSKLALFFMKLALFQDKIVSLEHIPKGWCAEIKAEKACFERPI